MMYIFLQNYKKSSHKLRPSSDVRWSSTLLYCMYVPVLPRKIWRRRPWKWGSSSRRNPSTPRSRYRWQPVPWHPGLPRVRRCLSPSRSGKNAPTHRTQDMENQYGLVVTVEWNPSNLDTNGTEESVHISELSPSRGAKLNPNGKEKVSLLERCPYSRGVLREVPGVLIREVPSFQGCP